VTRETFEVVVVVRRRDEFLVVHRAPEKGGYWHTIAGGVEPGEEWHGAAVRELHEETGLAVTELREIGGFEYVREEWEEQPGMRVTVRAFLTGVPQGWEPALDHEHDDYRWCTQAEAVELLFWPEPREILRAL
jgi:dATP pyrophosphohydrolase